MFPDQSRILINLQLLPFTSASTCVKSASWLHLHFLPPLEEVLGGVGDSSISPPWSRPPLVHRLSPDLGLIPVGWMSRCLHGGIRARLERWAAQVSQINSSWHSIGEQCVQCVPSLSPCPPRHLILLTLKTFLKEVDPRLVFIPPV